jgi:hypothetical protein
MKEITITVDTAAWEYFSRDRKIINPNRSTINDIIECLQDGVDIEKKPSKPQLRIIKKEEEPKETKQSASNITRIGPPPTETKIKIKINIEDKLFEDLIWAAERYGISVAELATEWATDYIDVCKPEMSDVVKAIYEDLGWNVIELVK